MLEKVALFTGIVRRWGHYIAFFGRFETFSTGIPLTGTEKKNIVPE
jgi:hypothetical protein